MPRAPRVAPGGYVYHVVSRARGKLRLFRNEADFLTFYDVLVQAHAHRPIRILGWCLMPNHWHFIVWPRRDGELSRFFGYLALTHAARWQIAHRAVGTGRVYQSRFKSCMIQKSAHLDLALRYVEGNPLRGKLVKRAEQWRWSSLRASLRGPGPIRDLLSDWPIPKPRNWVQRVNRPLTREELESIRVAAERGRPLGSDSWVRATVERFDLQSTVRPRGRQPGWRKKKAR